MTLMGISWPWKKVPKKIEGDEVIDAAIQDILFTRNGERKMNSRYGSQLLQIVFENTGRVMESLARREIMMALTENLPAIKVLNIDITSPEKDNDPVDIFIEYENQGKVSEFSNTIFKGDTGR